MPHRTAFGVVILCSGLTPAALPAQVRPPSSHQETLVSTHATGTFDVTLTPLALADSAAGERLGRMAIAKEYRGDLVGTGIGEMLTALTAVQGSAAYVAIERVTGVLHGRRGSFALQHSGVMTGGTQRLAITVVPDSGTDDLVGLSGTMSITIADGRHSYDFTYSVGGS